MTFFVNTENGYVNLAYVEEIERSGDGGARLRLSNGEWRKLHESPENIVIDLLPTSQAAECVFVGHAPSEDMAEPIIAWAITMDGRMLPQIASAEWIGETAENGAIRFVGASDVITPGMTYQDVEHWRRSRSK